MILKARGAISQSDREKFELESVQFFYGHVLGGVGLYIFDGAVAVGPKIETLEDHVKRGGTHFNGFEWVRPRDN